MSDTVTISPRECRRQKCWQIVRHHYHDRGWCHATKKYDRLLATLLDGQTAVLDIGCGRRFPMARRLMECGAQVHGVDPTVEPENVPPGATARRGTAEQIPYPDNVFDVVSSASVLEHLPNPLAAFREFNRVLKPSGKVVFLTPSRYDYVSLGAMLVPNALHARFVKAIEGRDEADTFPTYYRANSVRQIRRLAAETAFVAERLEYVNNYPYLLMFSPVLCRLAIGYDKLIQRVRPLHCLQGWLLGTLRSTKVV
jgi:ubiquinone/menaquinone biosynthesis C-methylase UbiE